MTNREGIQTFSRTYSGLRAALSEAIHVMDDLDDAAVVDMKWTFDNVEDEFVSAIELGRQRRSLEDRAAELVRSTARVAELLQSKGYSVRDISGALEMSPGRVSQILAPGAKRAVGASGSAASAPRRAG
ncbi:hypothetical protein VH571_09730 [Frondihabitans sp. 4ASC-45]|uniref:hypothetical protein n=1 Tax=Frondihabitans sp. 4ASC-45 TaxID=3111636 RepID=UPI003C1DD95F